MALLKLENVTKRFGGLVAVDAMDLDGLVLGDLLWDRRPYP